jgi:hypothetical protein
MCPDVFFVECVPVPPKYEKQCVAVSRLRRTLTHYVTHRSHQMQKHKFSVMCPGTLFMETDGDREGRI